MKKSRTSAGAEAIHGLTKSISQFGDKLVGVFSIEPQLRTPHCRRDAVRHAQQEAWLSKQDRLLFCSVLEKDINAVDVYSSLEEDDMEFRQMWINEKVEEEKEKRRIF